MKAIVKLAAILVIGSSIVMYILYALLSKKFYEHIPSFRLFRRSIDLSCIFPKGIETIDLELKKSETFDERSIYLIDSACAPLDVRKSCAIESAAKSNPNWTVHVMYYGGEVNMYETRMFLTRLKVYKNIVIKRIELPKYLRGTPFEALMTYETIQQSEFPEYFISDLVKLATLYKHGGVILNWDMFLESSLDTTPDNFLVDDSGKKVSSRILRFSNDTVAKEMMVDIIRAINLNLKIWIKKWDMLENALREVCENRFITYNSCFKIPILNNMTTNFSANISEHQHSATNITRQLPFRLPPLMKNKKDMKTAMNLCPNTINKNVTTVVKAVPKKGLKKIFVKKIHNKIRITKKLTEAQKTTQALTTTTTTRSLKVIPLQNRLRLNAYPYTYNASLFRHLFAQFALRHKSSTEQSLTPK